MRYDLSDLTELTYVVTSLSKAVFTYGNVDLYSVHWCSALSLTGFSVSCDFDSEQIFICGALRRYP